MDLEVVAVQQQEAIDPLPLSHRVERESFLEANLEELCSFQHKKSLTLQTEQSRHSIWEAIYLARLSRKFTRKDEGPKVHLIDQSIHIRFPEPNAYTPIHHDGLGTTLQ
jgi:hypothetical protein